MKKFLKEYYTLLFWGIIFGLILNGFLRVLKYFFGEVYYIDALGFILVCFYGLFAIKNDIKKSDLTKKNLENIEIKYGSVALFYMIVIILIWLMLIYIRFF
ncbi:hypothetical protein [Campylobacter concisus]|uniref:hypothetical protein n=1 Tax=Campylobacter concisus TaxID=199 RepID=UPI000CD9B6FC|nr:hypothetical protein [Campylobacter concisus]